MKNVKIVSNEKRQAPAATPAPRRLPVREAPAFLKCREGRPERLGVKGKKALHNFQLQYSEI